jgi:hypothetical protein
MNHHLDRYWHNKSIQGHLRWQLLDLDNMAAARPESKQETL